MSSHDESYKLLFSHPQMVADLLQGFVQAPWVAELDFTTLEAVKSSFVSSSLKRREEDVIWRVRWKDRWLYLYLLLAFQSTPQHFMAIRVAVYVGLFYQDLIKEQKLTSADRLPPVLPIVIYNGDTRWHAPTQSKHLIESVSGLDQYQLQVEYLLLDEGKYSDEALSPLQNLVAALFRLENSHSEPEIQVVLNLLIDWLADPAQESLKQAFVNWLKWVLLPRRLPQVEIPELKTLQEMNTMLAERVQQWYAEAERRGELRGELRGEQRGWAKGAMEGEVRGEVRGKAMALWQLLEIRWGSVPETFKQQLLELTSEQLSECLTRVWTAQSLEEVWPGVTKH